MFPAYPNASRRTTAGRLALGWSLFLSLAGLVLLVALPALLESGQSGYCGNDDHPGPCTNQDVWPVPGLVVLAVAAWCFVASVGLLRHRRWARRAVAVTFSLWTIGALGALVNEATSTGGARPVASITWLVLLGYFATTVVLAAAGPTNRGVDPPTGAP